MHLSSPMAAPHPTPYTLNPTYEYYSYFCHSREGGNPKIYGGERKVQLIMFTYLAYSIPRKNGATDSEPDDTTSPTGTQPGQTEKQTAQR